MNTAENFSSKLSSFIPKVLIEQAIATALRKLNLISREEFDIQTKVLQRTREKIEVLEQKIASLEQKSW